MKIIEKTLKNIIPYENNPRKNDEAVEAVADSIKEFGFKQPIVIDNHGVIVAGHTRYKAAIRLGLETVPCVIADDLTDEQVKAFRIADNKTGELADWDIGKLKDELDGLDEFDIDMTDFGFSQYEVEAFLSEAEMEAEDVDISEYDGIGEMLLKRRRVIISYNPEDADALGAILGVDMKKVTYRFEEIHNGAKVHTN